MRKSVAFLAALMILNSLSFGQVKFRVKNLNADSLLALIPDKEGTEKVEALNLLSNAICRKNIDSSILLASQAIELSEKLEYQKGMADGYFNVGNGYFLLDSLQPTISNYLKALRIYEDLEPTEEYGNLCMLLGFINYVSGRFETEPDYGKRALQIYHSIGDSAGQSMVYLGTATVKELLQDSDSALYFIDQALLFIDPEKASNEGAIIYNEKGLTHYFRYMRSGDTADYKNAIHWFYKALELPDLYCGVKARVYINLGGTYLAGDTEESVAKGLGYFRKIEELADSCFDAYDFTSIIANVKGWRDFNQGNFHQAIDRFNESLEIIEERLPHLSINAYREPVLAYNWKYHHKVYKQSSYWGLYNCYKELGDFEKALEFYALSRDAEEEIYMEKNQNLITMLESISENEKTEKQIDLLAKDNELKALTIQQSRTYLSALAGFILILGLAGLFFYRQRKMRAEHKLFLNEQKLMHDLELKKLESEKLKELDTMKSKFFANISHEFRTPLTLIMRPLEKVLSKIDNTQHKKDLDVARKYAGKLQELINNLLALSKLESGKMQLRAAETDIVKLVNNFVQAFESLAKQKNIELTFTSETKEISAFVDREKFEQILNNLLSNAFKFTDDGGKITVGSRQYSVGSLQYAKGTEKRTPEIANCQPVRPAGGLPTANFSGQCVEIKVSDTGRGISPEHLPHIFDRFYQVGQENNSFYEGTGIGLALTKELVELHHGTIEVESQSGKGTTFTIMLPLGSDHLKEEEISDQVGIPINDQRSTNVDLEATSNQQSAFAEAMAGDANNQEPYLTSAGRQAETRNQKPILLVVEDNPDMRSYIREYFETDCRIIEAVDGLDGFEKSVEQVPDIIISDVMMPTMDGNEFCKKIKTDERTCHIPVILLTARAAAEHKIEGLETGADDFLTKPFDGDELQVRVKNLIVQRKRLNQRMEAEIRKSQSLNTLTLNDSSITSMDEQFLNKLMQAIHDQYADPEFSASALSLKIGLSRAQLHRKIKALIGQSTGDLIRSFRLIRAAELIKAESATIAEIAYDVGFSSPSYFSDCFRKQFGKLPSEFKD
jgi:signal transduction histidine kinase/CheY-like chemotaxis protein